MKKLLALLLILFVSFGSLFARYLKQDSTTDRRFRKNRTDSFSGSRPGYSYPRIAAPRAKKDGVYDRWYKEHKPGAGSSYQAKTPEAAYRNSVAGKTGQGRSKRSGSVRRSFMKQSGYPQGRRGFVIDHIVPVKKGGCDCPENMQWQTKAKAKTKGKRE